MKFTNLWKNEHGAVDLGSIMVGVIVIGLIGGVIAATVFAVIPWVQDRAAQQSLQSIITAQGAHKVTTGDFGSIRDLTSRNLLEGEAGSLTVSIDESLCVEAIREGQDYIATVKSASGKYFSVSSNESKPTETSNINQTCFSNMVFTIDTRIAGCSTYQFPASWLNVEIAWGDGTIQKGVSSHLPTHTYSVPDVYTVRVSGRFTTYGSSDSATMHCITEIKRWQGTKTTDLRYAFARAINLKEIHEIPSTATLLSFAFYDNTTFNGDISKWDTSNVTHLEYTFRNAHSFNQNINNWDTSNVKTMMGTFYTAREFNQPLAGWDTSNVHYMAYMFQHANNFNQPIGNWNTSNVTSTMFMFQNVRAFNQDISGWNMSKVNNIHRMFNGAISFDQDINKWDTSKVTDMSYAFSDAHAFNKPLNKWDTSKVADMTSMFSGAHAFNQNISNWSLESNPIGDNFRQWSALSAENSPFG